MIKVNYNNKIYKLNFEKIKAKEILKKLNLSPSFTIILKNSEIITEDEILNKDDEIEIISAISGG